MSLSSLSSTPAQAGAQLHPACSLGAALNNFDLRCWAPAFAGVERVSVEIPA